MLPARIVYSISIVVGVILFGSGPTSAQHMQAKYPRWNCSYIVEYDPEMQAAIRICRGCESRGMDYFAQGTTGYCVPRISRDGSDSGSGISSMLPSYSSTTGGNDDGEDWRERIERDKRRVAHRAEQIRRENERLRRERQRLAEIELARIRAERKAREDELARLQAAEEADRRRRELEKRIAVRNPFEGNGQVWSEGNPWAASCDRANPQGDPFDLSTACQMARKIEEDRNRHRLTSEGHEAARPDTRPARQTITWSPDFLSEGDSKEEGFGDESPVASEAEPFIIQLSGRDIRCSPPTPTDLSDQANMEMKSFLIDQSTDPGSWLVGWATDAAGSRRGTAATLSPDAVIRLFGVSEVFGADDVICRITNR